MKKTSKERKPEAKVVMIPIGVSVRCLEYTNLMIARHGMEVNKTCPVTVRPRSQRGTGDGSR